MTLIVRAIDPSTPSHALQSSMLIVLQHMLGGGPNTHLEFANAGGISRTLGLFGRDSVMTDWVSQLLGVLAQTPEGRSQLDCAGTLETLTPFLEHFPEAVCATLHTFLRDRRFYTKLGFLLGEQPRAVEVLLHQGRNGQEFLHCLEPPRTMTRGYVTRLVETIANQVATNPSLTHLLLRLLEKTANRHSLGRAWFAEACEESPLVKDSQIRCVVAFFKMADDALETGIWGRTTVDHILELNLRNAAQITRERAWSPEHHTGAYGHAFACYPPPPPLQVTHGFE